MILAAVVVIAGREPFEACLSSLRGFDTVRALTDQPGIVPALCRLGAETEIIQAPTCIETISRYLLAATPADWLLFIDPDEEFLGNVEPLRRALAAMSNDDSVAGCWMSYRYRFLGHPLDHTYAGLRKAKLVRPHMVDWPSPIHSVPTPTNPDHQFVDLSESVGCIQTDLGQRMVDRLARHAQWARLEADEHNAGPIGVDRVFEALTEPLQEYFVDRSCNDDGMAGVLNALLHVNKSIARLLFEAERYGISSLPATTETELRNVVAHTLRTLVLSRAQLDEIARRR